MRRSFYPKMAWSGIQHNKQFYLPYMFTCIIMVMMFYIVDALSMSTLLSQTHGGEQMQTMLTFGKWIIGIFTLIFLFYTSAFLNKRRSREFGLYNVLGMNKRNLAHIRFWETGMIAGIALCSGLLCGMLFSKLAELWIINVLKGQIDYQLHIETKAMIETIVIFLFIFLLILLASLRKMQMASPIELMRSEHTGEKPPKGNWLLALIGIVMLAAAYYLAVSIDDPLTALDWFFMAVMMVIVATYLLFIAASVTLCRIIQRNKKYYYQKQHFISIASMSFRMKRNGAGLASICVLSTMVLVMLSSTICLYAGTEDIMRERYPRDLQYEVHVDRPEAFDEKREDVWRQMMTDVLDEKEETPSDVLEYTSASFYGLLNEKNIMMSDGLINQTELHEVYVAPLDVYNQVTGDKEILNDGEAIVGVFGGAYDGDTLSIHDQIHLKVSKSIANFKAINMDGAVWNQVFYVFVPNFDEIAKALSKYNTDEMQNVYFKWYYGCNLQAEDDVQLAMADELNHKIAALSSSEQENILYISSDSYINNKDDFYGSYGGLLVLGILLGMVFAFAAVLIIYYKQVTEGYEDRSGFTIMQKVGMTKEDIRQSVNFQILLVFFAPLLLAGIHLLFAFPLLYKMLLLFGLNRMQFLAMVAVGCYLLFAIFYIVVYKMTSGVYYQIVSTQDH